MAYGLKYYYDFADTTPVVYRVNLYALDYTGDAAELTAGATPFTHDYAQSDKYSPITGCIFEFEAVEQGAQFLGQPDFFIEDIYPQKERSIYFELRVDPTGGNTLLHKGWLVAPRSGVSVKGGNQMISFTASCGLSQLKNEDFTGLEGIQSFFDTIVFILAKTGLELPFRIATKWVWFDGTTTGPVFESKYHVDTFGIEGERPAKCKDVLQQILEITNCELFQEDGYWTIRSVELAGDDTVEYDVYDADGTLTDSAVEVDQVLEIDKTDWSFSRGTEQQMASSIRTFTATVRSGRYADTLVNGHFTDLSLGTPVAWTNALGFGNYESYVGRIKLKTPILEPAKPNPSVGASAFAAMVITYDTYYATLLGRSLVSNWAAINQQQLNNGLTFELKGKFKATGGNFATNPVHLPITIRLKTDTNITYYYTPDKKLTDKTLYGLAAIDGGLFHYIPYSAMDLDGDDNRLFTIAIDQSLQFPKVFNYFTHIAVGVHPPVMKNTMAGTEYIDLYWLELRLKGQEFTETHEAKNPEAASESEVNLSFNFGLAETSILSNTALILDPTETKTVRFTDLADEESGNPVELCLQKRAAQYERPLIQFEDMVVNTAHVNKFSKYSNVIYIPWLTGFTNQRFKQLRRRADFRKKSFDFTAIEKL